VKEYKVKLLVKVEVLVFNKRTVNVAIFNGWLHAL
jgi:galactitol-specific phosphotransferase system IIC component